MGTYSAFHMHRPLFESLGKIYDFAHGEYRTRAEALIARYGHVRNRPEERDQSGRRVRYRMSDQQSSLISSIAAIDPSVADATPRVTNYFDRADKRKADPNDQNPHASKKR